MRHAAVRGAALGLTLTLGLVACAEPAPGPLAVAVDTDALDPAPWEGEFGEDDYVRWHEGRIVLLEVGDRIRDADLPGFPGAEVELLVPRPGGSGPLLTIARTVSGEDGRFRVGPGPAHEWVVRARKAGYADAVGGFGADVPDLVPLSVGGEIRLGIRAAHPVRVRLLDSLGAPVAGAAVRASAPAYFEEAVTAPDGGFTFRAPRATVRFACAAAGREPGVVAADVPTAGLVTVHAPRSEPVAGWVVDAATGRRLAGALVLDPLHPDLRARTDQDGRFELARGGPRLRQGRGRVVGLADGWGWRSAEIPAAGDLEIRLHRCAPLRGTVTDHAGRPLGGVRVLGIVPGWDGGQERVLGPVSGEDGAFELAWLPDPPRGSQGAAYVVALRRGLGLSAAVRVGPETREPVELRLAGERTVRGALRRRSGVPVPNALVDVAWDRGDVPPQVRGTIGRPVSLDTTTDASGNYVVHGAPADLPLEVALRMDGAEVKRTLPAGAPGESDVVLDVVLAGAGRLAGTVVDAAGEPVPGPGTTRVTVLDHPVFDELVRYGELRADGTFGFEDLPEGEYVVGADVDGYRVQSVKARTDRSDLELVARRPGVVRLRVTLPPGTEESPQVEVRLARVGGNANSIERRTVTAGPEDAEVTLSVNAGRYEVTVSGDVWRGRLEAFDVADGADLALTVPLRRTLRTRARLLDHDGEPIEGARVFVVARKPGARAEIHVSGKDGWIDLTGLVPGAWEARVVLRDKASLAKRFDVSGSVSDLELRLPPYGELVVVARTPAGDPLAEAVLALTGPDGGDLAVWGAGAQRLASRFRCDGAGRAHLRGVPAGTVNVSLRRGSREIGRFAATVTVGQTTEITIP